MVTVASYNLENLFSRPKAFNTGSWAEGEKILAAYRKFNTLIAAEVYSDTDIATMRELLVELGVYYRNTHGAIRRRLTQNPAWAWLRKNRGSFDTEPRDTTKDVEITATGRGDWIGWLELATEATDEIGTRMTARVIHDVDADILAVVEAEDRPSLLRLNAELLDRHYRHVMLVDGNDERGIDVGIMTKTGFRIGTIRSHVDAEDNIGIIFSRDCPDYRNRAGASGRGVLRADRGETVRGPRPAEQGRARLGGRRDAAADTPCARNLSMRGAWVEIVRKKRLATCVSWRMMNATCKHDCCTSVRTYL